MGNVFYRLGLLALLGLLAPSVLGIGVCQDMAARGMPHVHIPIAESILPAPVVPCDIASSVQQTVTGESGASDAADAPARLALCTMSPVAAMPTDGMTTMSTPIHPGRSPVPGIVPPRAAMPVPAVYVLLPQHTAVPLEIPPRF